MKLNDSPKAQLLSTYLINQSTTGRVDVQPNVGEVAFLEESGFLVADHFVNFCKLLRERKVSKLLNVLRHA